MARKKKKQKFDKWDIALIGMVLFAAFLIFYFGSLDQLWVSIGIATIEGVILTFFVRRVVQKARQ